MWKFTHHSQTHSSIFKLFKDIRYLQDGINSEFSNHVDALLSVRTVVGTSRKSLKSTTFDLFSASLRRFIRPYASSLANWSRF